MQVESMAAGEKWKSESDACMWEDCDEPAVDDHVIEHVRLDFHARVRLCAGHLAVMQEPKEKPISVVLTLGPEPRLSVHAD